MSGRKLRFLERRSQVPSPDPSTDVVVLDTWWTPLAAERADVLALRPVIERVLDETDLVDGSLERLDSWALATRQPERYIIDGLTWWHRVRMTVRWDLLELMVWLRVLAHVAPAGRYSTIEVPRGRFALAAAAQAWLAAEAGRDPARPSMQGVVITGNPAGRDALVPMYRRLRRSLGLISPVRRAFFALLELGPGVAARRRRLRERTARLSVRPPHVLAIAWAGAFQVVREGERDRRLDPHLALVLDRLEAEGVPVAMIVEGLDHRSARDWPAILADERIVPQSFVEAAWAAPGSGRRGAHRDSVDDGRSDRLDVDGVDLGPAMKRALDGYGARWQDLQARTIDAQERFLEAVRPGVIYLDREATRTRWIVAAQRRGIPVVAIQHGMIYRANPEYHTLDGVPAPRPDLTCVFGSAEREILVEDGGYASEAVVVTGSPRADPASMRRPASPDERMAVRRELGVADNDRLLVVSVAHNEVMGDLYSVAMVARLLGGPLPGVHVVVKIHPQDRGRSDYAGLLRGLAIAGSYKPPSVSVIRDTDLYRLLRSADAHLGQYSTVLTDAVVAGTPNLIAVAGARADPLGYVGAGVAVPVGSVDDVRSFMAAPRPPTEEARAAFLRRHFEPGDAVARIADLLISTGAHAGDVAT
ncbi:MAG: hypothetical protein ACRDF7_04035 [Candidatus Limnocylindrales bacterium]